MLKLIKNETYRNFFYFIKAFILCEKGDYGLAHQTINQAIPGVEKEENVALQIYIKNMKAWADLKVGDYEGAYHWAQKTQKQALEFFEKKNNDTIIWTTLIRGMYLEEKGKYTEAEDALKESLERLDSYYDGPDQHGDQAWAHIMLGNVYVKTGRLQEAKKSYETAEKIGARVYTNQTGETISELYKRFAMLGAYLGDTHMANRYLDLHKKCFGENHKGTKEILDVFQESVLGNGR